MASEWNRMAVQPARQPIRTTGNRRWIRHAGGPIPAAILILAALLIAGCSPKRVAPVVDVEPTARTSVRKTLSPTRPPLPLEAESQPRVAPETESDLPDPQTRPRSGRPGYRTTPGSVKLGLQAAELAREQMGKQYQWGAAGPDQFDCSGLTHYVFSKLGVSLPRVSRDQARAGQEIGRSELQAGDLVFFNTAGSYINHVGIYLDNGDFVHAPRRHMPVRTDSLNDSWWRQRFRAARRMP
jgi:cell wall-associated NlpC family hydrolase